MLERRRFAALVLAGLLTAACTPLARAPLPTPSPTSPDTAGFGLLLWTDGGLVPLGGAAPGAMPRLGISDGVVLDGAVAVAAIYPGPLWVPPAASSITPAGVRTVLNAAQAEGLLTTKDFRGTPMPDREVTHLAIVVGSVRHETMGYPDTPAGCAGASASPGLECGPGTPAAFTRFVTALSRLDRLVGADELSRIPSWTPGRISIRAVEPVVPQAPLTAETVAWPLAVPFSAFPTSAPMCRTFSGTDVAKILPALQAGNQLTRFRDADGAIRSLVTRALFPLEEDPCAVRY